MTVFDEAGAFHADGQGGSVGVFSVSVNGGSASRQREAFSSTYEMAADCVFMMAIADGPEVDLYMTASGDMGTYASPGVSGVFYRP